MVAYQYSPGKGNLCVAPGDLWRTLGELWKLFISLRFVSLCFNSYDSVSLRFDCLVRLVCDSRSALETSALCARGPFAGVERHV